MDEQKSQVIKFKPKRNLINDDELVSLFMGIIRVVKNNVKEEFLCEDDAFLNRKIDILEKSLESLKIKYNLLKSENEKLKVSNQRLKVKLLFKK